MADSEGDIPANAEVAAVGAIGIKARNTDVSTGEPAPIVNQAAVAVIPGAPKIVGDQPIDDVGSPDGRAQLEIPANGRDLTRQERRSLASKLSDPSSKGEKANAAIDADLKRRG